MGKWLTRFFIPLFLLVLLPLSLSAQEQPAEPAAGPTIGLGGELGVQFQSFIPGIQLRFIAPLEFSARNLTLTPYLGFLYMFSVMEDLHANFYLPLGVKLLFNKLNFGLRFDYCISLLEIFRHGIFDLTLFGYFPLVRRDHFSLALTFDLGASLLYRETYGARVLFNISPSLSAWYAF